MSRFSKKSKLLSLIILSGRLSLVKIAVSRETTLFCGRFQWNSDENLQIHVFFGVGTWNLWWFHWNRVFQVKYEALHPATVAYTRFSPVAEAAHFEAKGLAK